MIYEFITPSDPITFVTDDEKVAFTCALLLGNGKAGCKNEKGENLSTMLAFCLNPDEVIEEVIGGNLGDFIQANKAKVKECFESFSYGSISSRKQYDDAIAAITDVEKLKEFKAKHEDRNRSSLSRWVNAAWKYAERMKI